MIFAHVTTQESAELSWAAVLQVEDLVRCPTFWHLGLGLLSIFAIPLELAFWLEHDIFMLMVEA